MIELRLRHLSLALVAAVGVAASGCGGDEEQAPLLNQGRADTLLGILDDAERQFEDGECEELEGETLPTLEEEVASVSNEVDENLRTALEQESQELQQLANRCRPEEDITTAPPPEETVAPPPTETVAPTTTETVPPPTTEEETEPPPDEGENGEGENGENGNGGGPGSGEVTPPGGTGGGPPPNAGGPNSDAEPGSGGSAGAMGEGAGGAA